MPLYDFFRNIFGARSNQQPPNNGSFDEQWHHRDGFRNPIWQTDEDDSGDDDFKQPQYGMQGPTHFNVFSDPFEMARYFETQMDGMLKNFFGFNNEGIMSPFENITEDSFEMLPPGEIEPKNKNLRDEVLKPGYESAPANQLTQDKQKLDADLDGKVDANELSKVWKEPSTLQTLEPYNPRQRQFSFHTFGKSITTKIIRKPDGSMEQHQTIRDSDGNEETTISRQIGDKTHTVVTKKDKNGIETKTENLINMDENELAKFENRWQPVLGPNEDQSSQNPLNYFPWHKFFGPSPKL